MGTSSAIELPGSGVGSEIGEGQARHGARRRSVSTGVGSRGAVAGGADDVRPGGPAAGHLPGLRAGSALRVPGVRVGRLPGLRHDREAVAAPELLPARSLPARTRAEGGVLAMRHQAGAGAVGSSGERVHAAVRGAGVGAGEADAGERGGCAGGGDGQAVVADRRPLRERGARGAGLLGRAARRRG